VSIGAPGCMSHEEELGCMSHEEEEDDDERAHSCGGGGALDDERDHRHGSRVCLSADLFGRRLPAAEQPDRRLDPLLEHQQRSALDGPDAACPGEPGLPWPAGCGRHSPASRRSRRDHRGARQLVSDEPAEGPRVLRPRPRSIEALVQGDIMSVRRKAHVLPLDSELDQAGELFVAPPLPYEYDALAPVISADTLRVHHLKHHQGYADKLNALLAKSDLRGKSLEEI